ncbi:YusU family protein [Bacillus dakarensis]|uniref:YusU family protein n=1 Tax=Robertmurraya dakarensis TaxID=1926278 RepID=UPI000981496B|nr:YusU family protein [Bacillus dakarensis]
MNDSFREQFEALMTKYTELLVGDSTPELTEKVKIWAMYTYVSKSMPPLAKHWNELYPDAKEEMKELILEIKELNEQHRQSKK